MLLSSRTIVLRMPELQIAHQTIIFLGFVYQLKPHIAACSARFFLLAVARIASFVALA